MSETSVRAGCPRWIKIVLILSLAINVGVIGKYGGQWLRDHEASAELADGSKRSTSRHERRMKRMLAMLPEHRHAMAMEVLKARETEFASIQEAMRASHGLILGAVTATPFTPDKLNVALEQRRSVAVQRRLIFDEQLVVLITRLDDQDRAYFATRLGERLKKSQRR